MLKTSSIPALSISEVMKGLQAMLLCVGTDEKVGVPEVFYGGAFLNYWFDIVKLLSRPCLKYSSAFNTLSDCNYCKNATSRIHQIISHVYCIYCIILVCKCLLNFKRRNCIQFAIKMFQTLCCITVIWPHSVEGQFSDFQLSLKIF